MTTWARSGLWAWRIVSDDELRGWLATARSILTCETSTCDAIAAALHAFDVDPSYDGLAVAVLDHGNAPPGVSDRVFRFDHIRSVERSAGSADQLLAFAYTAGRSARLPDAHAGRGAAAPDRI